MRQHRILPVTALSIILIGSSAWADTLYRCEDGTYTNKAERNCPVYASTGVITVQPDKSRTAEPALQNSSRAEIKEFEAGPRKAKSN